MCSQDEWKRDTNNFDPPNPNSSKKSRFRFSESERLQALKELFNILCLDVASSEEEIWGNLRSVLCRNNVRFNNCSLRLLKDHMLEQIAKFKKYDSEEATESGKERLRTEWGYNMRMLLTVWCNYEHIINTELEKKVKGGRPRKDSMHLKKDDAAAAQAVRRAALQTIEENETFNINEMMNSSSNVIVHEENVTVGETVEIPANSDVHNYACPENKTIKDISNRIHTKQAQKNRNRGQSSSEASQYLLQKVELDQSAKKEKLLFKKEQHAHTLELQTEELLFKKAKLEFEEKKWKEQEDRKSER